MVLSAALVTSTVWEARGHCRDTGLVRVLARLTYTLGDVNSTNNAFNKKAI